MSASTSPRRPDDDPATAELLRRVDQQRRTYRGDGPDPVLTAIADAHRQRAEASQRLRLLIAYARECIQPHGYRLADLADAAGMSISGVRIAYDRHDIEAVHQRIPR